MTAKTTIGGWVDRLIVFDEVTLLATGQVETMYLLKGHTQVQLADGAQVTETIELEEDEFLAKATSLADPNPRTAAAKTSKGGVDLDIHGGVSGNVIIGDGNVATVNRK